MLYISLCKIIYRPKDTNLNCFQKMAQALLYWCFYLTHNTPTSREDKLMFSKNNSLSTWTSTTLQICLLVCFQKIAILLSQYYYRKKENSNLLNVQFFCLPALSPEDGSNRQLNNYIIITTASRLKKHNFAIFKTLLGKNCYWLILCWVTLLLQLIKYFKDSLLITYYYYFFFL